MAGVPLLTQAASILAQEVARMPASSRQLPDAIQGGKGISLPNFELPVSALSGGEVDRFRRYAHDVIETFLTAFSPKGAPPDDQVGMLRCAPPVEAGADAVVTLRVANEEATPSSVSLYSSSFVADNGYDIPSMRIAFSPRVVSIPAKSEVTFEVTIRVPQQAPPGIYSGLVQASGYKYLKAVVSVEVK